MSSAGGGSGIGSGGRGSIPVPDGVNVRLPAGTDVASTTGTGVAVPIDPSTAGRTTGTVRPSVAAELPKDNFAIKKETGVSGPTATQVGLSASDQELIDKVFIANGVPNPYNANTTEALSAAMRGTPAFTAAVSAATNYFQNPTGVNQADFMTKMAAVKAQFPNGNVMEVLFLVFRESIKETNEDKKYFLIKLQEYNDMAEGLSNYLSQLVNDSQRLSETANGQKYPEKVNIPVTVRSFDLSTLDPNGKLKETSAVSKNLDRAGLNDTIKDVESMQETVRNKRQMASTAFQNFDQKANQLYNLMSSVLKSVNEMRSGVVRNMM